MKINFLNRMLVAGVMGSLWLAGMNVTTDAQDKQQPDQTQQEKQGNDKPQKGNNQQDKNRGQQKKDQRAPINSSRTRAISMPSAPNSNSSRTRIISVLSARNSNS